jgi:hypothetical protein
MVPGCPEIRSNYAFPFSHDEGMLRRSILENSLFALTFEHTSSNIRHEFRRSHISMVFQLELSG